ncbi:MAG TPA: hypothetical protein ENI39_02895 [Anaerolineae bacterium]|nr:hypothetical protein [Anaerolineae bacterium]
MAEQMISPGDVTTAKIKGIFDGAFMDASITDKGDVLVTEGGIKIFLSVDTGKQLVRYLMLFGYRRGASEKDKLNLVNELNKNIVFMRAWSFGNGIAFDYALPYDGGLPPKQVISAYRWLRKTALGGIQQHDQKNLVA